MLVRFNKRTIVGGSVYEKDSEEDIANDLADQVVRQGNGAVVGLGGMSQELHAETDANNNTVLVGADGVGRVIDNFRANTLVIAGDSLSSNNYTVVGDNYSVVYTNGAIGTANELLGHPFDIVAKVSVGGKSHALVLTEQMPAVAALAPKFCYIGSPYNDLYTFSATGAAAANATIALIEYLLARNIIPIWNTVHARTYDSIQLKQHLDCNDRLRRYAAETNCGIFYDAFKVNVDIASATCEPRASWTYDTGPQVHWNATQGYYQGRALAAACEAFGIPRTQIFSYGAENQTTTTTGRSNILVNPQFSGVGGTVGANCTGTMPDSWTVDWPTRTGAGTAAAAIVDITDPDTGLVVAKGVQLTLGGTPAANDVLRIIQNGTFHTLLTTGDLMSAEGVISVTDPVAIQEAAIRVYVNTNEMCYAGLAVAASGGTAGGIPASDTFYRKTRELAVLGSGVAAAGQYDLRIKFSGAATGVITLSSPRVRKG